MGIVETVSEQLKSAMKDRDAARTSALRNIRAGFLNVMKEDNATTLDDARATEVLRRLAKQRQESIEAFDAGGRPEMAAAEDGLTLGAWPELPSPPPLDASAVPEVLSADLDARVALGQLRAGRLARVPTLHLMGGYQISDQPGPTYGASIALPLFAPGVAAVRGASARADGAEAGSSSTPPCAMASRQRNSRIMVRPRWAARPQAPRRPAWRGPGASGRRWRAGAPPPPDRGG